MIQLTPANRPTQNAAAVASTKSRSSDIASSATPASPMAWVKTLRRDTVGRMRGPASPAGEGGHEQRGAADGEPAGAERADDADIEGAHERLPAQEGPALHD